MDESMGPRRVLVIGGGFGGLACARHLAHHPEFEVTLIDRANHHLFQPLLYQVATASLAAPDIARSLRQVLEEAENVSVLMDEIETLDREGRQAIGQSGRHYVWDTLVLAVGAQTSFFGNDAWEPHMMGLKSLEDAQGIRRLVLSNLERAERSEDPEERRKWMTVGIVGGGPTGVELAGAFADLIHRSMRNEFRSIDTRQLRVVLVEGSERILEAYDEDQSEYARRRLERLGVEVKTGTRVADVTEGVLHFQGGEVLEARAIIWAAGVEANPLTRQLGVELADRAGRVTPLPDLSLPGNPDVFVIGDLVRMSDSEGKAVPGVAPAAVQMGKHVAKVLLGERHPGNLPESRPPFRYFDKGLMAIIGKNAAVVKSGGLRLKGYFAWLAWLLVHILFLIGFRNKLVVLLGWSFAYVHDQPGARIIVHRPRDARKEPVEPT
ncbi:NADH dehydrogenase [Haloferula luteola]|uniref:NADH:ubiquinone reductase (non-electrogenic) n=2 Tax=Haloferula luteola TaxID=595692 RepID=A0A840VEY5_9BACT|nr:NADH dehydrogenase [Haloferula luteola]